MSEKNAFSISDFAGLSRTTRDMLLHYDRFGILSPDSRGNNKYRYYSSEQITTVNLIRTLKESGMTLTEIKEIQQQRTPATISDLLSRQAGLIDAKIKSWKSTKKFLITLKNTIDYAVAADESILTVQLMPPEAVVLGNQNNYGCGQDDYDALRKFYSDIGEKYPGINMNYPVWALFSEERMKQKDWTWPDRYYFCCPEGNDRKPAGYYAVGYSRGGYGQSSALFERLLEYINKNGYEICGDAYEEYPLNEICISEAGNYLKRLMVLVRKKIAKTYNY